MKTEDKQISQADLTQLESLKEIYRNFPYSDGEESFPRMDELSTLEEIMIADIYFNWRGETIDRHCGSCLNEAFARLMVQLEKQTGKEFGVLETDKLKAELRSRVKGKLEREN